MSPINVSSLRRSIRYGRAVTINSTPEPRVSHRGAEYRTLLAVPGVARLLGSALLARIPLGSASLAILLLVHQQTGSFGIAGIAVGAFALTGAVTAPLQGALLDRLGPAPVLIPCATGQVAAFVALAVVLRTPVALIVGAAVAGALKPPISGCLRALWPKIASTSDQVEVAYALDATSQEMIWTAGPLLVALVIKLASPAAAVLLSAAFTAVGTALFLTTPRVRSWPRDPARRPRWGALASRPLRLLLATALFFGLAAGATEIGLPALAVRVGSASDAGILLAAWSVGSLGGGLMYGMRAWRVAAEIRYPALLGVVAVAVLPLLAANSIVAGAGCALLAGLPGAAAMSCQYVLVARAAPPGATAEAFTWSLAAMISGLAMGTALGGQLIHLIGPGGAFALSAGAAATAAAFATRNLFGDSSWAVTSDMDSSYTSTPVSNADRVSPPA